MLSQFKTGEYKILEETTVWDTDVDIPNHTYVLNRSGKMIAYIKSDDGELVEFVKPLSMDTRYRKFVVLQNYSKGDDYATTKTSCKCKGFQFRKTCKHVQALN